MDIKAQRLEILRQVEDGEISLEEAERWLAALEKVQTSNNHQGSSEEDPDVPESSPVVVESAAAPSMGTEIAQPAPVEPPQPDIVLPESQPPSQTILESPVIEPNGEAQSAPLIEESAPPMWRGWWMLVFIPGMLLLIASVNWMLTGFQAAGLSWGFWLSFIPFVIGILMVWLGWEIRIARWFHLHVHQKHGERPHEVRISFPLPTGLVSWGVRHFGHFSSPVRGKDIGEFLDEIDQAVATDGPMHIFVDDPDGDQVEIWVDGPRAR